MDRTDIKTILESDGRHYKRHSEKRHKAEGKIELTVYQGSAPDKLPEIMLDEAEKYEEIVLTGITTTNAPRVVEVIHTLGYCNYDGIVKVRLSEFPAHWAYSLMAKDADGVEFNLQCTALEPPGRTHLKQFRALCRVIENAGGHRHDFLYVPPRLVEANWVEKHPLQSCLDSVEKYWSGISYASEWQYLEPEHAALRLKD